MKPDDKDIHWIEEPDLGPADKSYVPLFVEGVTTTVRHLLSRKVTVYSPEQRHEVPEPLRYRGVHRLNRDAQGRVKCVACFLCATACPAHCIDIVGAEAPWPDREKYPQHFTIDELRCIFCGMCEEACPTGAVVLGHEFELADFRYQDFVYGKEDMLVGVKGAKWQRREAAAKGKDVELGFTAPPRPELEGVDY